jgi:hypothetical protein
MQEAPSVDSVSNPQNTKLIKELRKTVFKGVHPNRYFSVNSSSQMNN